MHNFFTKPTAALQQSISTDYGFTVLISVLDYTPPFHLTFLGLIVCVSGISHHLSEPPSQPVLK